MLDSLTAEHSARMLAMKLATDNADELIETLTLQKNKARQFAITKEVLEIAMSAEAVPGTGQPEIVTGVKEVEAERTRWAGVYMTGTLPGQHGISLADDGTMKLFELNAQGAPHLFPDTFRPGRIEGKLCVIGSQTNEPIYLVGPGTLRFGGETFLKIK